MLEEEIIKIIENKHFELNLGKDYKQKYSKIKDFEANAIGQIGEEILKFIISKHTKIIDEGNIHNEYDVKTAEDILFEVKSARKGRKNNSFQFNGLNPIYNYNYLICLGLCEEELYYRIFKKDEIKYLHSKRKYYINQNGFEKQLVKMNPGNDVNYKLTLKLNELIKISNINSELEKIFIKTKSSK